MNRLLVVLVLCGLALLALSSPIDGFTLPLTRRAHKREHLRRIMNERFDWPADQKLPIIHTRNARGLVVQQVPLLGNSIKLGEVYMSLPIGTPYQNYTAQVDTGSSDLGLPDNQCSTCGKVANVYNPTKSSSSKIIPCKGTSFSCPACNASQCSYKISYGDGSGYSARLYTDTLQIGSLKPVTQGLGGIYQEVASGPLEPFEPFPVDGIVGIAYQKLSETDAPTIVDSLVNSGQIANMFSLCLTDDGGTFEFGGQLPYSQGATQSTPIVKQEFYQVTITDMSVNGQSFGVSQSVYNLGGAIFDSGTTEFLMPASAYSAFKSLLQKNCTSNPLVGVCDAGSRTIFDGYCFQLTAAQIAAYPPIVIHFGSSTLSVPPQNYLLDGGCSRAGYYSSFIDSLSVGEGTILGDVVHRPYVVLYDRTNLKIAWTPVKNCPDGNA